MNYRLFTLPLLALTLSFSSSTSAQPYPTDFQVPEDDIQKWVKRLKPFCPQEGWSMGAIGNDIVFQRYQPVRFARRLINPTPFYGIRPEPTETEAGIFRLRVRFSRLMSFDRYEEISAQNAPVERQKQVLLDRYQLKEKWGELVEYVFRFSLQGPRPPKSPEALEASIKAYRAASKDLYFQPLPTHYTPDYSLTLYQSWKQVQYVYSGDSRVDRECNAVADSIKEYFGSYQRKKDTEQLPFGLEEVVAR